MTPAVRNPLIMAPADENDRKQGERNGETEREKRREEKRRDEKREVRLMKTSRAEEPKASHIAPQN